MSGRIWELIIKFRLNWFQGVDYDSDVPVYCYMSYWKWMKTTQPK
jgi:hypothetical protein